MLNVMFAKKETKTLNSGEIMEYLPIPESSYEDLKTDFKLAVHFSAIENIELTGAKGIYISCDNHDDGLMAAAYLFKKYMTMEEEEEEDIEFEYDEFDDEYDEDSYYDDEEEEDDIEDIIYKEGKLVNLPVVSATEFNSAYLNSPQSASFGIGQLNMQMDQNLSNRKPYWFNGQFPIIIREELLRPDVIEGIKRFGRFIIYISVKLKNTDFFFRNESIDSDVKTLLFESDFEYCDISKAADQYYELVLENSAKIRGYKISKSLDKLKLIEELRAYRGYRFASNHDIDLIVKKAIRKKRDHGKTLTISDFDKAFMKNIGRVESVLNKSEGAAGDLNHLVGLEDVKQQLKRIVQTFVFNKNRRLKGLKTEPIYCSAVFMGNPGTAKTTVARIFGKMLCDEGILENERFVEISRKDIIGKYVGHTAPNVAKIFEDIRGGTLFIDEAYSLMSEGTEDGYSAEAMSEIIRQMENNPQTLVILAGYTDKMKNVILNANPGLRSRLTNIIEFKDYSEEEMLDIFGYFLKKEDYQLADIESSNTIIRQFIRDIEGLGSENLGNGRLMRKLFQSAVGFMAERPDHDLKTLHVSDIEHAINEILKTEKMVSYGNDKIIGFEHK